ncbi:MAG: hypothetical protein ACRCS9_03215 [Hyphomicrobium sp.]
MVFWVNAEAAAERAAALALGLRSTFDAVVATRALVFSVLPFCVSADAATDFSALLALLLARTLAAADETFLLVDSDFAMGMFDLSLTAPERHRSERRVADSPSARNIGKDGVHDAAVHRPPALRQRTACTPALEPPAHKTVIVGAPRSAAAEH